MLHGRSAERARIDELLAAARSGRSGVLALRGEPGIGKSALLGYAATHADGFRVLAGAGTESESEFPFAAVHQLLGPLWDRTAVLPERQRTAVDAAFGRGPAAGDDRFLVSLGILGLLSDAADERPVLCLIDDAQWLDVPSADALAFVARRLEAEGIVMLFAVRDDATVLAAAGLPEARLGALDTASALALLSDGPPVSARVRDLLVDLTAGHPLALRELAASLSTDQLDGRAPLPDRLPLGEGLGKVILERIRLLPNATQTMLLLAAAEQTGDVRGVLAAADLLDLPADALDDAEAAGIVAVVGDNVTFRQPMVRSAVYGGAPFLARRAAHRALAAILTRREDAERRTWQLAAAAVGPEETLAAQLAAVADAATARGGHASAATALERAAELTPSAETQARRLLAAARSAWRAGKPERAGVALEKAAPLTTDVHLRAGISRLHGRIAFACGEPDAAYEHLRDGADLIEAVDPALAASMLAEVGQIAWVVGDARRVGDAAGRLLALPAPTDRTAVTASLVVGLASFLQGDTAAATAALHRVAESVERSDDAMLLGQIASAALFVGDDARALSMFTRAVAVARTAGAVDTLPMLMAPLGALQAWTGRYGSAATTATEGLRLALDTGQGNPAAHHRSVLAWMAAVQGREQDCRDAAAATLARAIGHRLGPQAGIASWSLALLDLGMGRAASAFDRLQAMATARTGEGHDVVTTFAAADRVEAAMRVNRPDQAAAAAITLRAWAGHVQAPWALALAARCDALLDEGSEEHFARAAELHAASSRPFDAARTELLRGESLRRRRSRAQARTHLRAACEAFEGLGATPWADRARVELQATGETTRKRDPSTLSQLTPQELHIARLVGAGGTNREIAAELFLSPRTVDYHLHKVFTKLGITSRAELVRLDAEG